MKFFKKILKARTKHSDPGPDDDQFPDELGFDEESPDMTPEEDFVFDNTEDGEIRDDLSEDEYPEDEYPTESYSEEFNNAEEASDTASPAPSEEEGLTVEADAPEEHSEEDARAPATGVIGRIKTGFSRKPKPDAEGANEEAKPSSSIGVSKDVSISGSVLSFGRAATAIGLRWSTIEDGESPKEVAKTSANAASAGLEEKVKLDLYADLRSNGFVGFGSSDDDLKKGMPILVTSIPEAVTGPRWIGVFNIGSGSDVWWLGSMRDGQVFEDQIIHGRTRAEEAFQAELEAPDWSTIYAPGSWGMSGTDTTNLWDIVDLKNAQKIKYLRPEIAYLPRLIMAVIAIGLVAGSYHWYQDYKAKQLAELELLRRQMDARVSVNPKDYPWYELTRVKDLVTVCEKQIEKSVISIPGWEGQPISCAVTPGGKGKITTGWSRIKDGRFSMLRSAIPVDFPNPSLSIDGKVATLSRTFETSFEADSHKDDPWAERVIEIGLRERLQSYGLEISLRPSKGNVAMAKTHPVFNSTDVRVSSAIGLHYYGDMFKDVPALVPQAVIYNVKDNSWDLLMQAYHPIKMPPTGRR